MKEACSCGPGYAIGVLNAAKVCGQQVCEEDLGVESGLSANVLWYVAKHHVDRVR
jgi:hypothetical protein